MFNITTIEGHHVLQDYVVHYLISRIEHRLTSVEVEICLDPTTDSSGIG